MHDEAATHYIDMIDQTTLGHGLIKVNFNVTPRAGWQIDPFGHSAVQAYLLGAEVNLHSLLSLEVTKWAGWASLLVAWLGNMSKWVRVKTCKGGQPLFYQYIFEHKILINVLNFITKPILL